MKAVFSLLFLPLLAYCKVDWLSSDGRFFTYTPASNWTYTSNWTFYWQEGGSGCGSSFFDGTNGSFTFKFPTPSTTFSWWGFQQPYGKASVCLDGATGNNCHVVDYSNATLPYGAPTFNLFSATGLSNVTHTVTVTNIPDPDNSDLWGVLSVDRITLDGAYAALPPPKFPSDTTIVTIPMASPYHVNVTLGGHSPALNVLLDAGAAGNAWAFSDQCTGGICYANNKYTPSGGPSFYNFSISEEYSFGDGSNWFEVWRVNDTFTFGSVTTPVTFGAAYLPHIFQAIDGNFGLAKGYYIALQCARYPNFVEDLYANGQISYPIVALYLLQDGVDQPAPGVGSVAQIGGVDKNKFVGSIDWTPMSQDSQWIAPNIARTIMVSDNNAPVAPGFAHTGVLFDTGDPTLMGVPTDDWNLLLGVVGATQDDNGAWLFPCQSRMTINMKGSQGRTYTFYLADRTQNNNGMCPTFLNDMGYADNWIMGVPFLSSYYLIFDYYSNLMGLAAKNLNGLAATTSVFVGQT